MTRYTITRRLFRERRWSPTAAQARTACITDYEVHQAVEKLRTLGYELVSVSAAEATIN